MVKLRHTNPTTLLPVLDKLVGADERVGLHTDSASVVVVGGGSNTDRILSLIEALDTPASLGLGLEVVSLRYLPASQVQDLLSRVFAGAAPTDPGSPPAPSSYRIVPVPGRSALVLLAPPERLPALRELIGRVDSLEIRDRPLRIYRLRVASAAKLAPFLLSIVAPSAGGGTPPGTGPSTERAFDARSGLAIVPDTVTNSLMVLASLEAHGAIARLVQQLDYEGFQNYRTRVFSLQHARAISLADELDKIANRPGEAEKGAPPVVIVPDRRLNTLIVSTQSSAMLTTLEELVTALDQPGVTEDLTTHVYYLSHAPAKQVERVLKELYAVGMAAAVAPGPGAGSGSGPSWEPQTPSSASSTSAPGPVPGPSTPVRSTDASRSTTGGTGVPAGSIRVVADELTNSLVILSTEAAYQQITRTLQKLHVDPLQVLVQVVIAEVSQDREHILGSDLAFTAGQNNIRTDFGKMLEDSNTPNTKLKGLKAFVVNNASFEGLLHAFHRDLNANVLATPKLFANNNQEASILIGRQVPIITGRTLTSGGNSVSTVEYKDVGTKLNLLAQINRKRSVTLRIQQEVKTIAGTGVENNPILDTREARTTVTVQDGQAVLLGGLLQDEDVKVRAAVPGLGRLPVLRWFFGDRDRKTTKRELVFVFMPRVVSGVPEGKQLTAVQLDETAFRHRLKNGMPASELKYRWHRRE
ncbi:MAG: hypothetical protein HY815_15990 [Candidatus Riflebacteria bacterium]|nr:hypothetical protein [Candidatus Riflebacteria bacterium]